MAYISSQKAQLSSDRSVRPFCRLQNATMKMCATKQSFPFHFETCKSLNGFIFFSLFDATTAESFFFVPNRQILAKNGENNSSQIYVHFDLHFVSKRNLLCCWRRSIEELTMELENAFSPPKIHINRNKIRHFDRKLSNQLKAFSIAVKSQCEKSSFSAVDMRHAKSKKSVRKRESKDEIFVTPFKNQLCFGQI